jgi:hypothetical protein
MKAYIVDKRDLDELKRRLLDIGTTLQQSCAVDPTEAVQRRITYVFEMWKSEVLP